MPGSAGLIQISTYGNQDLYLTGSPQISFFKTVYRRATNFSMENVELPFQGDNIDFGNLVKCRAEKVGDLMYKTYVSVQLPQTQVPATLTFPPGPIPACGVSGTDLVTATNNLNLVTLFVKYNMIAYRTGIINSLSPCIENPLVFCDNVIQSWETCDPPTSTGTVRSQMQTFLEQFPLVNYCNLTFDQLYLGTVVNNIEIILATTPNYDIVPLLADYLKRLTAFHKIFVDAYDSALELQQSSTSTWASFAWIKRIGHFLFEYIDIEIGGKLIDRQWGDWVNIWYELTGSAYQINGYNNMIGDVPVLTDFNTTMKPYYQLNIPIPFWFSRHNGLAFPLISLQYFDVDFSMKIRPLSQLAYVSANGTLQNNGIALSGGCALAIEYIYLDADERKRFAQSNQEYLIEQVRKVTFTKFSPTQNTFVMDNFVYPVKSVFWTFQRNDFITNPNETNQCMFYNYTLNTDSKDNPIKETQIRINTYQLGESETGNYYNYLIPWSRFDRSPSDGINTYSFAFKPIDIQPTGSCNMSRIDSFSLVCTFDPLIQSENIQGTVTVYMTNYNILRFMAGFAGLAFT